LLACSFLGKLIPSLAEWSVPPNVYVMNAGGLPQLSNFLWNSTLKMRWFTMPLSPKDLETPLGCDTGLNRFPAFAFSMLRTAPSKPAQQLSFPEARANKSVP